MIPFASLSPVRRRFAPPPPSPVERPDRAGLGSGESWLGPGGVAGFPLAPHARLRRVVDPVRLEDSAVRRLVPPAAGLPPRRRHAHRRVDRRSAERAQHVDLRVVGRGFESRLVDCRASLGLRRRWVCSSRRLRRTARGFRFAVTALRAFRSTALFSAAGAASMRGSRPVTASFSPRGRCRPLPLFFDSRLLDHAGLLPVFAGWSGFTVAAVGSAAHVVLRADGDPDGRRAVARLAAPLRAGGRSVFVVDSPDGADVADLWRTAGATYWRPDPDD